MELILRHYQTYAGFRINLQNGFSLITGDTGIGKSTIFRAIHWVLYGTNTSGLPAPFRYGKVSEEIEKLLWEKTQVKIPTKSPTVYMELQLNKDDRIRILRHSNPSALYLWINDPSNSDLDSSLSNSMNLSFNLSSKPISSESLLRDVVAQHQIQKMLREEELWICSSYIIQDQKSPLISGTNSERMSLLNQLTFSSDILSPEEALEKVNKEINLLSQQLMVEDGQKQLLEQQLVLERGKCPAAEGYYRSDLLTEKSMADLAEQINQINLSIQRMNQQYLEQNKIRGQIEQIRQNIDQISRRNSQSLSEISSIERLIEQEEKELERNHQLINGLETERNMLTQQRIGLKSTYDQQIEEFDKINRLVEKIRQTNQVRLTEYHQEVTRIQQVNRQKHLEYQEQIRLWEVDQGKIRQIEQQNQQIQQFNQQNQARWREISARVEQVKLLTDKLSHEVAELPAGSLDNSNLTIDQLQREWIRYEELKRLKEEWSQLSQIDPFSRAGVEELHLLRKRLSTAYQQGFSLLDNLTQLHLLSELEQIGQKDERNGDVLISRLNQKKEYLERLIREYSTSLTCPGCQLHLKLIDNRLVPTDSGLNQPGTSIDQISGELVRINRLENLLNQLRTLYSICQDKSSPPNMTNLSVNPPQSTNRLGSSILPGQYNLSGSSNSSVQTTSSNSSENFLDWWMKQPRDDINKWHRQLVILEKISNLDGLNKGELREPFNFQLAQRIHQARELSKQINVLKEGLPANLVAPVEQPFLTLEKFLQSGEIRNLPRPNMPELLTLASPPQMENEPNPPDVMQTKQLLNSIDQRVESINRNIQEFLAKDSQKKQEITLNRGRVESLRKDIEKYKHETDELNKQIAILSSQIQEDLQNKIELHKQYLQGLLNEQYYRKIALEWFQKKQQIDLKTSQVETVRGTLVSANRLKQLVIETECQHLEEIVDQINVTLEQILPNLFEHPINIQLLLFKQNKSNDRIKPQVNFRIIYKQNEYNSFKEFSGGERNRISLALTLAVFLISNSPFLLLDEILSSLGNYREIAVETIQEISRRVKRPIILIEHIYFQGQFDQIHQLTS